MPFAFAKFSGAYIGFVQELRMTRNYFKLDIKIANFNRENKIGISRNDWRSLEMSADSTLSNDAPKPHTTCIQMFHLLSATKLQNKKSPYRLKLGDCLEKKAFRAVSAG